MPNIGGPELIIILLIAVLLFGAKKLPELGRSMGQSITNFKKGIDEAKEEGSQQHDELPSATAADVQTNAQSKSDARPQ